MFLISASFLFYKYQFIYKKNFYTVIPNTVYRSGQPNESDIINWKKIYNIKSILNLRGDVYLNKLENKDTIQTYNQAEKLGIKTKFIALSSKNFPKPNEIREISDFIIESPKPLLIHCKHGVDRTSMVSAIALILNNKPIDTALGEMTSIKGFFPQRHQEILRLFLLEYKNWLTNNHYDSNKQRFRYWLENIYTKSYFDQHYHDRTVFSYLSFNDWHDLYSKTNSNTAIIIS